MNTGRLTDKMLAEIEQRNAPRRLKAQEDRDQTLYRVHINKETLGIVEVPPDQWEPDCDQDIDALLAYVKVLRANRDLLSLLATCPTSGDRIDLLREAVEKLGTDTPEACRAIDGFHRLQSFKIANETIRELKGKLERLEKALRRQAESHASIGMVLKGGPTDAGMLGCMKQCDEFAAEAHVVLTSPVQQPIATAINPSDHL